MDFVHVHIILTIILLIFNFVYEANTQKSQTREGR